MKKLVWNIVDTEKELSRTLICLNNNIVRVINNTDQWFSAEQSKTQFGDPKKHFDTTMTHNLATHIILK